MPALIDIKRQRFGRLLVQRRNGSHQGAAAWLCKCDCGKLIIRPSGSLRSGRTRSCGCLMMESATTHNRSHEPEYKSWASMLQRCNNEKNPAFRYYGQKGVRVCKRWHSFENFFTDMGKRPAGKTLDRWPNPKGDYQLSNCRWATKAEQVANTYYERKLTKFDVAEIRKASSKGLLQREIAKQFGICRTYVNQIINHKVY